MTGKVFNGSPAAFLVLILPLAVGIILLYKAWLWVLGVISLIILWKFWDKYQWQKWCFQLNPTFNELLQENQGCLTPMDLSLKANLSAGNAKRFLQRKAEEYGAYRKDLPEQGPVYYFITASTLGSIFDDSEPSAISVEEENIQTDENYPEEAEKFDNSTVNTNAQSLLKNLETNPKSDTQPTTSPFAQLAELKEERQQLTETEETPIGTDSSLETDTIPTQSPSSDNSLSSENMAKPKEKLSLIQVDLAKRLDTTPSTIGRRKTESNFPQWSQSKDPEGIAWKYLRKSRVFIPVDTD
ncbi:MAG TPA: hypothetical protein DCF68_04440 [Cyanothece sp. UBA12306]|nr:hypothetical protein [Cyanothece sp. UBA12306]